MNFWNRVGTFLLFVGLVLATLFLFSDMAGVVQIKFLLWGALAIVVGGLIKWKHPLPRADTSGRFRLLTHIKQKSIEKKKIRQQKKQAGK